MQKLAIAVIVAILVSAATVHADEFDSYWYDGKAELDGYALRVSRYGQERVGHAVMIFVTEPFSESKRVKVDDPKKTPDDTFTALKLNLVRDFQTGIYDYNTMMSVFTRVDDFDPVKITFGSAEWCGQVYLDMLFFPKRVALQYFSYFEGESGSEELKRPAGGIAEDALFIQLRGLRGAFLQPGETKQVDFLPGAFFSRLSHKPTKWMRATITRRADMEKIEVPAGEYETIVYDLTAGDRKGTFFIDREYPHRIVRWSLLPDVSGELTGTLRLDYWHFNHNGDESYLKELGLPVIQK